MNKRLLFLNKVIIIIIIIIIIILNVNPNLTLWIGNVCPLSLAVTYGVLGRTRIIQMVGNPMRSLFLSKELLLRLRKTSVLSSGINTDSYSS